jgi:hypothetical protein
VTVLDLSNVTTIFTTQTPLGSTGNDGQPIEVGVKFRSSTTGYITGIRFYKTAGNSGTHIGELYSSTGTRLGQATFTGETATGWQMVTFGTPVAIAANTTYVAAYFSSLGNYIGTAGYFNGSVNNPPLTALADGLDGPNGVYIYAGAPTFPSSVSTGGKPNYWVDVMFSDGSSQPLPVEYLNFTVTKENDDADLQWTTANEQNNKGFEIQRSSAQSGWEPIGFVPGVGNSQTSVTYNFTDYNLQPGTYFYRLRQIDLDGNSHISKVLQINFPEKLVLELKQNHPNPFSATSTIDIVIPKSGRVVVTLYDQTGRPVHLLLDEFKTPGTYQINVNRLELSSGVYYYNMDALGKTIVRKMIIY